MNLDRAAKLAAACRELADKLASGSTKEIGSGMCFSATNHPCCAMGHAIHMADPSYAQSLIRTWHMNLPHVLAFIESSGEQLGWDDPYKILSSSVCNLQTINDRARPLDRNLKVVEPLRKMAEALEVVIRDNNVLPRPDVV